MRYCGSDYENRITSGIRGWDRECIEEYQGCRSSLKREITRAKRGYEIAMKDMIKGNLKSLTLNIDVMSIKGKIPVVTRERIEYIHERQQGL